MPITTTTTSVILNLPSVLTISNLNSTIDIQGESVAFRNVNLILESVAAVSPTEASGLFVVFDNISDYTVQPAFATTGDYGIGISTCLSRLWRTPFVRPGGDGTSLPTGYGTDLPGRSIGGIVLTADDVPANRGYKIHQWLSKLAYDNITFRFLSPASIAGASATISQAYENHMSAVRITSGDTVATSVFVALKEALCGITTDALRVRKSLYSQMFAQDPARFDYGVSEGTGAPTTDPAYPNPSSFPFSTDASQPLPFMEGDEIRFLTNFVFNASAFSTDNNALTSDDSNNFNVNKLKLDSLLGNLQITPDSRVVEFRMRIGVGTMPGIISGANAGPA